nr:MAG TPA: hypothetical protein [Caudoviricetes sp.]
MNNCSWRRRNTTLFSRLLPNGSIVSFLGN